MVYTEVLAQPYTKADKWTSQSWWKLRAHFVSPKFLQLSYCLKIRASEASGLEVEGIYRDQ